MKNMEHLKTEINWLDGKHLAVAEQQRHVQEIQNTAGVMLGVVNISEGKIWFVASYDADAITQKEVQDSILAAFETENVFVSFEGYTYAPIN